MRLMIINSILRGRQSDNKWKADDSSRNNHGHHNNPSEGKNSQGHNKGTDEMKPYRSTVAFQREIVPNLRNKMEEMVMHQGWSMQLDAEKREKCTGKPRAKVVTDEKEALNEHLRQFCELVKKYHLYAKYSNCEFLHPKVQFPRDTIIDSRGITCVPSQDRESIKDIGISKTPNRDPPIFRSWPLISKVHRRILKIAKSNDETSSERKSSST
ncbi:hypothetical protein Tco_0322539 [Tanacetum coccineum]